MSDPVRFHISLNVADLTQSVVFFRANCGSATIEARSLLSGSL